MLRIFSVIPLLALILILGCQTPYSGTLGPEKFDGWVSEKGWVSDNTQLVCIANGFDEVCLLAVHGTDGLDGKDGADGLDGSDGKDGQIVQLVRIVEKLVDRFIYVDRVETEYVDRVETVYVDRVETKIEYVDRVVTKIEYVDRVEYKIEYVDRIEYIDRDVIVKEVETQIQIEYVDRPIDIPALVALVRAALPEGTTREDVTDEELVEIVEDVIDDPKPAPAPPPIIENGQEQKQKSDPIICETCGTPIDDMPDPPSVVVDNTPNPQLPVVSDPPVVVDTTPPVINTPNPPMIVETTPDPQDPKPPTVEPVQEPDPTNYEIEVIDAGGGKWCINAPNTVCGEWRSALDYNNKVDALFAKTCCGGQIIVPGISIKYHWDPANDISEEWEGVRELSWGGNYTLCIYYDEFNQAHLDMAVSRMQSALDSFVDEFCN